jgi:hypothetical protein
MNNYKLETAMETTILGNRKDLKYFVRNILAIFIFIVVPCISIISKFF